MVRSTLSHEFLQEALLILIQFHNLTVQLVLSLHELLIDVRVLQVVLVLSLIVVDISSVVDP